MRRWAISLLALTFIVGWALLMGQFASAQVAQTQPVRVSQPCYRIAWVELPSSERPQFYDVHQAGQVVAQISADLGPTWRICTPTPRELVDVEIVGRYADGSLVPYGPRVFEYVGDFDRDGDGVYGFSDFGALAAESSFGMASFGRFVQLFGHCIEPGGTVRRCPRPRRDPRCVLDPAVEDSLRYCPR